MYAHSGLCPSSLFVRYARVLLLVPRRSALPGTSRDHARLWIVPLKSMQSRGYIYITCRIGSRTSQSLHKPSLPMDELSDALLPAHAHGHEPDQHDEGGEAVFPHLDPHARVLLQHRHPHARRHDEADERQGRRAHEGREEPEVRHHGGEETRQRHLERADDPGLERIRPRLAFPAPLLLHLRALPSVLLRLAENDRLEDVARHDEVDWMSG